LSRIRWQSLHLVECEPFDLAGFPQSTQMILYSRLMVDSLTWTKVTTKDEGGRLPQGCVLGSRYRDFNAGRIVNINTWREWIGYS
jgi:hypothetical protein